MQRRFDGVDSSPLGPNAFDGVATAAGGGPATPVGENVV